jgi:hypothetical protein
LKRENGINRGIENGTSAILLDALLSSTCVYLRLHVKDIHPTTSFSGEYATSRCEKNLVGGVADRTSLWMCCVDLAAHNALGPDPTLPLPIRTT